MQSETRPTVIAVDFDGCLCVNRWPEIGEPNVSLIDGLRKMQEKGAKIILWTCREGEALEKAVAWCREMGLEFDAVNDNTEQQKAHFGNNCRKVGADMYIDDKAVRISADRRKAALEMEGEAREPAEDLSFGYPLEDGKVIGYRFQPENIGRHIWKRRPETDPGDRTNGGAMGLWRRFLPGMKRRK